MDERSLVVRQCAGGRGSIPRSREYILFSIFLVVFLIEPSSLCLSGGMYIFFGVFIPVCRLHGIFTPCAFARHHRNTISGMSAAIIRAHPTYFFSLSGKPGQMSGNIYLIHSCGCYIQIDPP
ncbi:hypothetical protein GGS20DRAFT_62979 [Poronia punctata]|nr:hypothetical protein GGS20DRAFT_62979 [Poronia punctata]